MSQISKEKSPILTPSVQPRPRKRRWIQAIWAFSRPHTVVGTSLSVLGIFTVAIAQSAFPEGSPVTPGTTLAAVLLAWATCLCGNVYIVGLNQLQDIDIDRVNKPQLPLASGALSVAEGWLLVSSTGLAALLLAPLQGAFLTFTVWSSLLIGTAYSLPPLRLKRFPFWASMCIFMVRGAIVNVGLFLHFSQQLQHPTLFQSFQVLPTGRAIASLPHQIPASVWALTVFIIVFSFAIAIFKDIPDMEGDRRYNITTFTIRLGQRPVFNLARWVLTLCYLGMSIAGILLPQIHAPTLVLTHLLLLAAVWGYSLTINLQEKRDIARYYQFIWKLFFLEYILFPLSCLLGYSSAL